VTDEAIAALAPRIGTRAACAASGVPQATWYRRHRISPPPPKSAPVPHAERVQPRALAPAERQAILAVLHSDRFADLAPDEIWATLLDEGTYLGSVSTYYRCCARPGRAGNGARRPPTPPPSSPSSSRPGRTRCTPWDITKLHGPAKWTYYHLYVILDIYSRYVVGWMVATRESAALAEKLIAATCAKQGITRGQLSIHADRGSSMTSKPVALLLADLGITQSHSRPHVSNDNPYSEAQFKTLKYRPGFPARFPSIQAATAGPQPSRPGAPGSWPPPTTPTPSASSASRQPRRNCQAHPGSTRPRTKRSTLNKTRMMVPHSG
jgi:putative transposase